MTWEDTVKEIYELIEARKPISKADSSKQGLMSKEHKNKLDNVSDGANYTVVDTVLGNTANPVRNSVVANIFATMDLDLTNLNIGITEAADSKGNPNTYSGMQKLIDQLESDITIFEETIDWIRGEACSPIGPPPA